jgi:hypothetical protein
VGAVESVDAEDGQDCEIQNDDEHFHEPTLRAGETAK